MPEQIKSILLQKKQIKETPAHASAKISQNKPLLRARPPFPPRSLLEPQKKRTWNAAIWGGGIAICIIALLAATYLNNSSIPQTPPPSPFPTPTPPIPTPSPFPIPPPPRPTPSPVPAPTPPIPTPSLLPTPPPPRPIPAPVPAPTPPIPTPSPLPTPPPPIPIPSPVPTPPACVASLDFIFSQLRSKYVDGLDKLSPGAPCVGGAAPLDLLEFFKVKDHFPSFIRPVLEAYGKPAVLHGFDISFSDLAEFEKIKARLERLAPELMGTSASDALQIKIKETQLTDIAFSARLTIPFNAQKTLQRLETIDRCL